MRGGSTYVGKPEQDFDIRNGQSRLVKYGYHALLYGIASARYPTFIRPKIDTTSMWVQYKEEIQGYRNSAG